MTWQMTPRTLRRTRRWLAGTLLLTPVALAAPASASPPSSWPDTDNPSTLASLLLVVGVPAVLFAVIFLLSYLPSMIRGQRYVPAEAWRDEPEWFGGPSRGAGAAPAAGEDRETGGASARW